MKRFCSLLLLALFLSSSACGGRLPSAKTAQKVTSSYFQRYGKKYKLTPYAPGQIDHIAINGIEESSYKTVYTDAIIKFKDGSATRALVKMENRFPGGWRVLSWESLNSR